MGKRTAQQVAEVIEPSRSKETIARWARGDTVPSALDIGPLARALGVRIEFLVDPPALPSYPLSEYLLQQAAESGVEEGVRRGRQPRAVEADEEPAQSPPRSSRGTRAAPG
jgi:hypothetical protein